VPIWVDANIYAAARELAADSLKDMTNDMEASEFTCLTADVGGTNVRFGVVHRGSEPCNRPLIEEQMIYPCSSFDSIDVAMETYRSHLGVPLPQVACVAVAGPVKDNIVRMTNRDWLISGTDLTKRFGFEKVFILNDAEAIAYATRVIDESELKTIKPGTPLPDAPAAVITAGTGVGVAAIAPFGGQWFPLASEAGHVNLAPHTDRHVQLFEQIEADSSSISAELLLSGEGIRRLYLALAAISGVTAIEAEPKEIVQRALDGADDVCTETMKVYCDLMGAFAGDIALTFGARGGVYLAGNVLRQVQPFLSGSGQFRKSFENKGAMAQYLAEVPVNAITTDEPGLVGASAWFDHAIAKPA
jgi:glucokinase